MKLQELIDRVECMEERLTAAEGFLAGIICPKPPFPINDPPPMPHGPWGISDRMTQTEWLKRFVDGGLQMAREEMAEYVLQLEAHVQILEGMIK